MEAYEIRLELLKMAKDILMEDWDSTRAALEQEWLSKVNYQDRIGGHKHVSYPAMPPVPSVARIIELATDLNTFVSRKV